MYYKLFECGVWESAFNSNLKEYCYDIQKRKKGRTISNLLGWQSNDLDLSSKSLKPLISHIEEQTNQFSKLYVNSHFKMMNMWININPPGGSNRTHTHPNSMFSGVYYVSTPKDCGNIVFQRPDIQLQLSYTSKYGVIDGSNGNPLNSPEWWKPSKQNTCYIFPSFMSHWVEPNCSKEDRISLSFNLV